MSTPPGNPNSQQPQSANGWPSRGDQPTVPYSSDDMPTPPPLPPDADLPQGRATQGLGSLADELDPRLRPPRNPVWPLAQPQQQPQQPNVPSRKLVVAAVASGLVVILCLALLAALLTGRLFSSSSSGGNNTNGGAAGATQATAAKQPSATRVPTATLIPTATALPTITPQPTTAPAGPPPQLSVAPTQTYAICSSGDYHPILVSNGGGQTLNWAAASSAPQVQLSASSGSLGPGQSQTITLSGTYTGPKIVIFFNSNGGSAQVAIRCALV